MKSLRLRIAAILIAAIVVVVLIATSAVMLVTTRPDPQRMIWPVASQIIAIHHFYQQGGSIDGTADAALPTNLGPLRTDLTDALKERLAFDDIDVPVAVYDLEDSDEQIAFAELGGRNLRIEFPTNMGIPTELWLFLGSWLGLVVAGVIAVSLFMANRVTQPFVMLEQAVNAVGPDGVLPHIPEIGSGEARQTAATLNRLSARLRSAMDSRMRLVAAAGHDLRTPMTRMRIRAEFLSDEDREAWTRDIDELELIADSAIRLVKEEVSDAERTELHLDQLVRDTVADLAAQGHAIELTRADPVVLPLPQLSMQRALRNLMINAATHGRCGTVRLIREDNQVRVEIADEGPGIPPDLLDRVFEPFFRAEPGRIQTVPGAGLGLAIAKEIIDRSGGTFTIENRKPKGILQIVTFTIEEPTPDHRL